MRGCRASIQTNPLLSLSPVVAFQAKSYATVMPGRWIDTTGLCKGASFVRSFKETSCAIYITRFSQVDEAKVLNIALSRRLHCPSTPH